MERLGKYNGTLMGKDLSFDSLYNTYEHAGFLLDRSEIRRSVAARRAAADATDYLYFVANTQAGIFLVQPWRNTTRNVVKYRRCWPVLPADPPPPPPTPVPKKKHGKQHRGKAR